MNTTLTRISSALIVSIAFAANAHAEYRCDPAPTSLDQRACKAAEESPEALRRFVQRLHWFESLQFSDYVDQNTAMAWEAQKRHELAQKMSGESVIIVASSDRH